MKRKTLFFILTAVLLLAAGSVHASYYQKTSALHNTSLEKKGLMRKFFAGSKSLGEQVDPNTNFYYLRARWMSPSSGRFVSVDPYRGHQIAPISLHRYLYANQNPINASDHSGLITLMDVIVVSAIINVLNAYVIPLYSLPNKKGYFAERPLWGFVFPGDILPPFIFLDLLQIEPVHEQIFFGDGGGTPNVGFFNESQGSPVWNYPFEGIGRVREDKSPQHYRKTLANYESGRLRAAVKKVSPLYDGTLYMLFGNNCQDFARAVRAAY